MRFTKMHGCSNDYIYINEMDVEQERISDKSALSRTLCDRHIGVGADGIVFIRPSKIADCEMQMFNADGSYSQMCGNGIRCVGKYLYEHNIKRHKRLTVESGKEIKILELIANEFDLISAVRVDMGAPILEAGRIPARFIESPVIMQPLIVQRLDGLANSLLKNPLKVTCVSMGNPHAVIFCDFVPLKIDLNNVGPMIENHSAFPERVNAEFVQVTDRKNINFRVWERGSGETLACGTGACAAVVASVLNGFTDNSVSVHLRGGDLFVEWDGNLEHSVYMTGPAEEVFEGEYNGTY